MIAPDEPGIEPDTLDTEPDDLDLDSLVPLAVLAAELDTTAAELARRIGDDNVFLDGTGFRCTTEAQAAALIADRNARAERERQRRHAQRQPALDTAQLRQRVQAIAAKQRELANALDGVDLSSSALARVTADDQAERIARSSSNLDDYLSGDMTYHRIRTEE